MVTTQTKAQRNEKDHWTAHSNFMTEFRAEDN